METQCQHLKITEPYELLKLLQKFDQVLDGTLGAWKTDPVNFELRKDSNTICSQPYPVPMESKEMFKKEVEILVLIGFLEAANDSGCGFSSFA